jgi:hypothetical protein
VYVSVVVPPLDNLERNRLVLLPDTLTSTPEITVALDLALTHILAHRLQLAQGYLPVAVDAHPHRLDVAASIVYQPVNFRFSEN